ncbi:MAG: serine/threonine protein phosphatase [Planctomycetales bacterium]|nr:serine/threonine protein phosphatase [Planctomycetales bacterium]
MSGRLIAIGDIHGCCAALEAILAAIAPTAEDTLVTLGDYVDRGPDSKGVIDRLIALGEQCNLIALQGNHEEMMLDVVRDSQPPYRWLQYGGVETLDSYRFSGDMSVIPKSHHDFFASMLDYYETDEHFFVHANYAPEVALAEQPQQLLRWEKLTDRTPPPHCSGKRAVVGHTHDRGGEIFDIGHLVCIDTYCYGGGWLTALDVESGQLWQADIQGELR